jgi:CheY-like chemotaxis protein
MNSLRQGTYQSRMEDSETISTEQSLEPHLTRGAKTPRHSGALRLLVVDDYADTVDSLALLLRAWGHQVLACLSGQEALEAAATYRPDAALVDIMMPGMDGCELARHLRGRPELLGITLVAVTGLGDKTHRQLSQEAGFALHLLKPVESGKLREILAAIVDKRNSLHG